ncbi:MAG TPA: hypothetical protein ENI62_04950 [Gammaproteobacteria bacterium]|nr:hypothetical protein [Gammaproteobacteria bacterium]
MNPGFSLQTELTFEGVFKTASARVKRLQNNPQAVQRFTEIRQHVENKEGGIGLLDHKMRSWVLNQPHRT